MEKLYHVLNSYYDEIEAYDLEELEAADLVQKLTEDNPDESFQMIQTDDREDIYQSDDNWGESVYGNETYMLYMIESLKEAGEGQDGWDDISIEDCDVWEHVGSGFYSLKSSCSEIYKFESLGSGGYEIILDT
jgi:hypothetical protein